MRSLLSPQGLQAAIQSMGLTHDQRDKFLQFVRGAGLVDERVLFAMHLFDMKTGRPEIHRRLESLYEVSPRTAQRIAAAALDMRRICATEMAQISSKFKTG